MTNSIIFQEIEKTEFHDLIRDAVRVEFQQIVEKLNLREVNYNTRKKTAQKLNISLVTLNEYTNRGIIEACRIGSRILYTDEAIEKAIKNIMPRRGRG